MRVDAFFDAVRADDIQAARQLLAKHPTLARVRWRGRAGDGTMGSLGPPPYNKHTWTTVPDNHDPVDPRFTSTPLIYTRNDEMVPHCRGTMGASDLFSHIWNRDLEENP
jgi:hypothetical protein